MITIRPATENDVSMLTNLAKQTFIESHGHSAPQADIDAYIAKHYTDAIFYVQLKEPGSIYFLIFHDKRLAGYSKLTLHSSHPNIPVPNVSKLDRIYLLNSFYGLNLGQELLQHNIELSKVNGDIGMWLFTWKENERAVRFYERNGFRVIGSHDFPISETHTNPNHQLWLDF